MKYEETRCLFVANSESNATQVQLLRIRIVKEITFITLITGLYFVALEIREALRKSEVFHSVILGSTALGATPTVPTFLMRASSQDSRVVLASSRVVKIVLVPEKTSRDTLSHANFF